DRRERRLRRVGEVDEGPHAAAVADNWELSVADAGMGSSGSSSLFSAVPVRAYGTRRCSAPRDAAPQAPAYRQDAIGALGPQTVGRREIAFEVTWVDRTDRGQLMDEHVRPRPANRVRDRIAIKRVSEHRHGAQPVPHRLI